jgi:peroxiredoxin
LKTRTLAWVTVMAAGALVLGLAACQKQAERAPRNPSARSERGIDLDEPGPIRPGTTFPNVTLTTLDGRTLGADDLLLGKQSLVLFASTTCEACHDLIEAWTKDAAGLPGDVQIVTILDEDVDFARQWRKKTSYRFPLFCDTKSAFSERHDMHVYPTVVGVSPEGRIKFVMKAATPLFTPARAAAALKKVEGEG